VAKKTILDVLNEYGLDVFKEGTVLRAYCPFHNDTHKPNFTIYPESDSWFCPTVDTLVLLSDLTWKKAGTLTVGDELVGVEEIPITPYRKFVLSKVQKVRISNGECFKISTNKGIHVGSKQHLFLCRIGGDQIVWKNFVKTDKRYKAPKFLKYLFQPTNYQNTKDYQLGYVRGYFDGDGSVGKKWYQKSGWVRWWDIASVDREGLNFIQQTLQMIGIKLFVRPFNHGSKSKNAKLEFSIGTHNKQVIKSLKKLLVVRNTKEFKRGYLAGFFDAEGTREQITIYNQNVKLLKRIQKYAATFGFKFHLSFQNELKPNYTHALWIRGDVVEQLRFFSVCQPKIKRKRDFSYYVSVRYSSFQNEGIVEKIQDVGMKQIVEIETSSKTLITGGFVSHNCFACGEGGDVIRFISKHDNISYNEARKKYEGVTVDLIELQEKIDGLQTESNELPFNQEVNICVSQYCNTYLKKHPENIKAVLDFLKQFDERLNKTVSHLEMQTILETVKRSFVNGE